MILKATKLDLLVIFPSLEVIINKLHKTEHMSALHGSRTDETFCVAMTSLITDTISRWVYQTSFNLVCRSDVKGGNTGLAPFLFLLLFFSYFYYLSRLFVASSLLSFIKHIIAPGELFCLLDLKTHACTAGCRLLFLATWRWVSSSITSTHVVSFHCTWWQLWDQTIKALAEMGHPLTSCVSVECMLRAGHASWHQSACACVYMSCQAVVVLCVWEGVCVLECGLTFNFDTTSDIRSHHKRNYDI